MSTPRRDVQGDIMRWLLTGPATDTPTLAKVMGIEGNIVAHALRRLQEKGFVSFTYKMSQRGGRPGFHDIRLTTDGERNMPDPIPHAQTGSKWTHALPSSHPGDMTDYKNHPSHTSGSQPVRTVEVREQPIQVRKVEPQPTPTPDRGRPPSGTTIGHIGVPYPMLTAIRNRIEAINPLRKAAHVLPKDDPLRRNIEARIDNEINKLSPLEQEYWGYANSHPDTEKR